LFRLQPMPELLSSPPPPSSPPALPPFTFVASSRAAGALYQGCEPSTSRAAREAHRLPDFIVVGVQKGGTSSLKSAMRASGAACFARSEMHFFDAARFRDSSVADADLLSYASGLAQSLTPGDADCLQNEALPLVEKTPNYYYAAHAALRLCEALPRPRLVLLLRDPIARTYSGNADTMPARLALSSVSSHSSLSLHLPLQATTSRRTVFSRSTPVRLGRSASIGSLRSM